ncbi:MAG: hypothetical protein M1325_01115 [Actinobacteria bacterium]|nr:hypothetical protein [Actinomycetota bacterium]
MVAQPKGPVAQGFYMAFGAFLFLIVLGLFLAVLNFMCAAALLSGS